MERKFDLNDTVRQNYGDRLVGTVEGWQIVDDGRGEYVVYTVSFYDESLGDCVCYDIVERGLEGAE